MEFPSSQSQPIHRNPSTYTENYGYSNPQQQWYPATTMQNAHSMVPSSGMGMNSQNMFSNAPQFPQAGNMSGMGNMGGMSNMSGMGPSSAGGFDVSSVLSKVPPDKLLALLKGQDPQAAKSTAQSILGALSKGIGTSPTTVIGTIASVSGSVVARYGNLISFDKCPEEAAYTFLMCAVFSLAISIIGFLAAITVGKDPKQLSPQLAEENKQRRTFNASLCGITVGSFVLGIFFISNTVNHCLPWFDSHTWSLLGAVIIACVIFALFTVKVVFLLFFPSTRAYLLGLVTSALGVGANALLSNTSSHSDPANTLKHTVLGSQQAVAFVKIECNKKQKSSEIQGACVAYAAGSSLIASYAGIFATTPKDDTVLIKNLSKLSAILFKHLAAMELGALPKDPKMLKSLLALCLFPGASLVVKDSFKAFNQIKDLEKVIDLQLTMASIIAKSRTVAKSVNKLAVRAHRSSLALGLEGMRFCDSKCSSKLVFIKHAASSFNPSTQKVPGTSIWELLHTTLGTFSKNRDEMLSHLPDSLLVEFLKHLKGENPLLPNLQDLAVLFHLTSPINDFYTLGKVIRNISPHDGVSTCVRRQVLFLIDDAFPTGSNPTLKDMYTLFYENLLEELLMRYISPIQISPDIHPTLYSLLSLLAQNDSSDVYTLIRSYANSLGPVAAQLVRIFFYQLSDLQRNLQSHQFRSIIINLVTPRLQPVMSTLLSGTAPYHCEMSNIADFFGVEMNNDNPIESLLFNIFKLRLGNPSNLRLRIIMRCIQQRGSQEVHFANAVTTLEEFQRLFPNVNFKQPQSSISSTRLSTIIQHIQNNEFQKASNLLTLADLIGSDKSVREYLLSLYPHPLVEKLLDCHPKDQIIQIQQSELQSLLASLIPKNFEPILEFYFDTTATIDSVVLAKVCREYVEDVMLKNFLTHFIATRSIVKSTKATVGDKSSEIVRRLHAAIRPIAGEFKVFGLASNQIAFVTAELLTDVHPLRKMLHVFQLSVRMEILKRNSRPKSVFGLDIPMASGTEIDAVEFRKMYGPHQGNLQGLSFPVLSSWSDEILFFSLALTKNLNDYTSLRVIHKLFSLNFEMFYHKFADQVVNALQQLAKSLDKNVVKLSLSKLPLEAFSQGVKASSDYVCSLPPHFSEDKLLQHVINFTYGISIISSQIAIAKSSLDADDFVKISQSTLSGVVRVYQAVKKNPHMSPTQLLKSVMESLDAPIDTPNSFSMVSFDDSMEDEMLSDDDNDTHIEPNIKTPRPNGQMNNNQMGHMGQMGQMGQMSQMSQIVHRNQPNPNSMSNYTTMPTTAVPMEPIPSSSQNPSLVVA